jgi:hypothetical protein
LGVDVVKGDYNLNLEEMLLKIPAGPERERAAIALDEFLGIPHIPTEGYEQPGGKFLVHSQANSGEPS